MNVLAVDQGTSSTKALVVTPDGRVLATAEVALRPRYAPGGVVEQDPAELLASVIDAGREAVRTAGEPIAAVGVANQGETVLAWNRASGSPFTVAIGWQDRRAEATCRAHEQHRATLEQRTGLGLDAYFAAPKMRWLRDHLSRAGVVTTSDTWLLNRLTGAFVTDAATASRTMLLDLETTDWSDEALTIFGLDGEALPTVVDCAGPIGETTAFTDTPVPVTGLIVDQQAALFGQGCLDPASAKCTYGTGAFFMMNLGARAAATTASAGAALTTSVAWRLAGNATYCRDGQVFTAASAVRWLVDLGVLADARDLDKVAETVNSSGGVTFVPALAGLGSPWSRADVRGSVSGLGLDTVPGNIVRALVDGIAAQVVELVHAAHVVLPSLRVDGGMTRSRLLMQTQADLLGIPVEVSPTPDATALGVAAMTRLGLEPGLSAQEAAPRRSRPVIFEPQISADEASARRAQFLCAVETVLA